MFNPYLISRAMLNISDTTFMEVTAHEAAILKLL